MVENCHFLRFVQNTGCSNKFSVLDFEIKKIVKLKGGPEFKQYFAVFTYFEFSDSEFFLEKSSN